MHKFAGYIGILGASLALSGCGGDGGGGVNTVSTTPVTNTSLANLKVNQSFANNAATQTATFDLTAQTTTTGSSASQPLAISYDTGSNSYTITTQGRSQTFAPAASIGQANGIAQYKITAGATTDYLTLEAASVTGFGTNGPQYSGLAYWQRNLVNGTTEQSTLDIFTYGIGTAASGVPRTGQATYGTTVFGLVTIPGLEPRIFQGSGAFSVDFVDGVFATSATTTETGLISGSSISGGGVGITGSGTLTSGTAGFSGRVGYGGLNSSSSGVLNGQFYGPAAQELGATFNTTGADGSAAVGAVWGLQGTAASPFNLTLNQLVTDQVFYAQGVQLLTSAPIGGPYSASTSSGINDVSLGVNGSATISGVTDVFNGGFFKSTDKVASSDANFSVYKATSGGMTETFSQYKTGNNNSELPLTYATFGTLTQTTPGVANSIGELQYFVYGLNTLGIAIAARTGSASYAGVAYATAFNAATGTTATVKGPSSFTANFGAATYSGNFTLGNSGVSYGTFNVAGAITNGMAIQGTVSGDNAASGQFNPTFFGPTGQEFGGPFQIAIPSAKTTIAGAAIAKGG